MTNSSETFLYINRFEKLLSFAFLETSVSISVFLEVSAVRKRARVNRGFLLSHREARNG